MAFTLQRTAARAWVAATVALVALAAVMLGQPAAAQADEAEQDAAPVIRIQPSVPIQLSEVEQEYWDDPDFRRRFTESYLAETDLEPKPTTQEEVDAINKTLDLMNPPAEQEGEDSDAQQEPAEQTPEQTQTRLQAALDNALKAREDPTFSVLIDFLIANLYLNMAMNMPEPAAPDQPGDDASEQAVASYESASEAYEAKMDKRQAEIDELMQASAEYYERAVNKFPKYRRAWRNLGLVHVRLKQYDQARKAFGQVVMLGGGDPDTYGLMGFCYTNLGQHLPAESAYRMANLLEPEKMNWKMGLVRSFLLQKRYPEAVALTDNLIKQEPTNEQLWLFQANAYLGMNQIDRAAENYEILNGMGKSTVGSVNLLANIYTNKGLYDTAVTYYQQAIELAEGDDAERLRMQLLRSARVLSTRGRGARSATKTLIDAIDKAYGDEIKDDDLKDLLMLKARIAVAEGKGGEQAKILEQVVELDPLDGEALVLLGQYHVDQYKQHNSRSTDPDDEAGQTARDHLDQAILYYERAETLEDEDVVADAYVRHAQALVISDRAGQAVPLLKKAQNIKPRESVQNYLDAVERMAK